MQYKENFYKSTRQTTHQLTYNARNEFHKWSQPMASLYPGTGWCPVTLMLILANGMGVSAQREQRTGEDVSLSLSPAMVMKISLSQTNRGRDHISQPASS